MKINERVIIKGTNGKTGRVIDYISMTGRAVVRLPSGKVTHQWINALTSIHSQTSEETNTILASYAKRMIQS